MFDCLKVGSFFKLKVDLKKKNLRHYKNKMKMNSTFIMFIP